MRYKAIVVPLVLCAASALAAERANPLAGLPSDPGPHVAKIQALGDNAWLNLGTPKADPKWGVARGRAWGGRALTAAPDLGGAFFCGEGVHAYVKPDGYYMSDLWFYDHNAHRWLCLYPGVHAKTVQLRLDEHGFEVNQQGEHTPIAFLGHAYGSTTYDSDLRKYVVIYANISYVNARIKQRQEWLGVPPEKRGRIYAIGNLNASAKHPLFWDVAGGKWERRFVPAPGGFDHHREDGVAQYIPSLKKTLFAIRDQVWLYDYQTNRWTGSAKTGCPLTGYENGCYDSKRNRLYIARGKQFARLDVAARKWTEVKAPGQPENFASTNTVCLNYDAANDVILYHINKRHRTRGFLSIYDIAAGKWTTPENRFPGDANGKAALVNSFYAPGLKVHFFYLANDSSTRPGLMFAYRYKNAKKEDK
ncbi:MAG: hypothetical protein R6V58_10320 [Planctomycetota bacterium]